MVELGSFVWNASQAATFVSCCLWSTIAMFFQPVKLVED